jgi:hypothetical protein
MTLSEKAMSFQEEHIPELMEHGEWPSYPSSKKAFFSGYASIRPVPDYSAIMPFLRLNRAIATIGALPSSAEYGTTLMLACINLTTGFLNYFSKSLKSTLLLICSRVCIF